MTINPRWIWLLAACGATAAALATRMRQRRHSEKQAHKANLHEWENEGGNLAPPPEAPATVMSAGQA